MECESPLHKSEEEKTTCEICGKQFQSHHALVSHIAQKRTHNFCEICGEDFTDIEDYKDPKVEKSIHKNREHPDRVKCGVCYLEFCDQESFKEHMESEHPNEFLCEICGEECKSDLSIQSHKRVYHRDELEDEEMK